MQTRGRLAQSALIAHSAQNTHPWWISCHSAPVRQPSPHSSHTLHKTRPHGGSAATRLPSANLVRTPRTLCTKHAPMLDRLPMSGSHMVSLAPQWGHTWSLYDPATNLISFLFSPPPSITMLKYWLSGRSRREIMFVSFCCVGLFPSTLFGGAGGRGPQKSEIRFVAGWIDLRGCAGTLQHRGRIGLQMMLVWHPWAPLKLFRFVLFTGHL